MAFGHTQDRAVSAAGEGHHDPAKEGAVQGGGEVTHPGGVK
jgi:hypothetical protein